MMEEVQVYAYCNGNYATFYEIYPTVVYDITNNINLDDKLKSLKYYKAECDAQGQDAVEQITAYLFKGKYYLKLN